MASYRRRALYSVRLQSSFHNNFFMSPINLTLHSAISSSNLGTTVKALLKWHFLMSTALTKPYHNPIEWYLREGWVTDNRYVAMSMLPAISTLQAWDKCQLFYHRGVLLTLKCSGGRFQSKGRKQLRFHLHNVLCFSILKFSSNIRSIRSHMQICASCLWEAQSVSVSSSDVVTSWIRLMMAFILLILGLVQSVLS